MQLNNNIYESYAVYFELPLTSYYIRKCLFVSGAKYVDIPENSFTKQDTTDFLWQQ